MKSQSTIGQIVRVFLFIPAFLFTIFSLAYLGIVLIYPNYCSRDFHLFLFGSYLIGASIIGFLCYWKPEKTVLEDFVFIIHQSAAFASVKITLFVLAKDFPNYLNIRNATSVIVLAACFFIFATFIKMYRTNQSQKSFR
jgi:hypothetical protein